MRTCTSTHTRYYTHEDYIGNKYTFVCFHVFILGNIKHNMLILIFAVASELCLTVMYVRFTKYTQTITGRDARTHGHTHLVNRNHVVNFG